MTYGVRIKNNPETIDIGEFSDINEARAWAILRYGAELEGVSPVYTTQATTMDPAWILVGLIVLYFLTKKN